LHDRSNFYAEQGGQVGDTGTITRRQADSRLRTRRNSAMGLLHLGRVIIEGYIEARETASLEVSGTRAHTMRNHNCDASPQLGRCGAFSAITSNRRIARSIAEKTRFDFSHDAPIKPEEIAEVERLVNERIYSDLSRDGCDDATRAGEEIARRPRVFGERVSDPVRVLMIGPSNPEEATPEHSVEFCGGTHLHHNRRGGLLSRSPARSSSARASGASSPSRVEARSRAVQKLASVVDDLKSPIQLWSESSARASNSLQGGEQGSSSSSSRRALQPILRAWRIVLFAEAIEVKGAKIITGRHSDGVNRANSQEAGSTASKSGQRRRSFSAGPRRTGSVAGAVTDDMVKKGAHAGNAHQVRLAPLIGGKGGGKPDMAQGGGKDASSWPRRWRLAKKAGRGDNSAAICRRGLTRNLSLATPQLAQGTLMRR